MARVEEILRRASRITGLRYGGASDTGSEAELLRQALEDVYIDVTMEVGQEERIHTHRFTASNNNSIQTVENYNEYLSFNRIEDESLVFADDDTGPPVVNDPVSLSSNANRSGIVVTDSPATQEYVEGVDYNVTLNASTGLTEGIQRIPGGNIGETDTVLVSYFQQPSLLIDDDIRVPPFLKLRHVVYNQSTASSYPLVHVSVNELLEYRRGFESTGYTRMYAMSGQNLMRLWPRPQAGDSIDITFIPLPPKLSENDDRPANWDNAIWDLSQWDDIRGVESTPSLVPIQFHWNTLLPGVVVQALDKDQRTSDAQLWQARYEAGIAKMHLWLATYANTEASPVFDSVSPRFSQWPDQYSRGWSH